jgi:hypothetical protein
MHNNVFRLLLFLQSISHFFASSRSKDYKGWSFTLSNFAYMFAF